jgi:IS5 family transposase
VHKPARKYEVSAANVHDSQVFDNLLDEDNSSKAIRADSACRSKAQEARLREQHYRSHSQRKGSRNKPLTAREQQGNRTRATVRARVAQVFGALCATRTKLVRRIGLKRRALAIGMMNLVYNMRRLCYLQGVGAPA